MEFTFNGQTFNSETQIIKGKDLKLMRVRAGLTTMQAAERIAVKSRKTIENWEIERCQPTIETFMQLCSHYGFNPGLVVEACLNRTMSPTADKEANIPLDTCIQK